MEKKKARSCLTREGQKWRGKGEATARKRCQGDGEIRSPPPFCSLFPDAQSSSMLFKESKPLSNPLIHRSTDTWGQITHWQIICVRPKRKSPNHKLAHRSGHNTSNSKHSQAKQSVSTYPYLHFAYEKESSKWNKGKMSSVRSCVRACARACVRACFSESRDRERCPVTLFAVAQTWAVCLTMYKLILFEEKQANTVHVLTQQENATPFHSTYCLVPLRLNSFRILSWQLELSNTRKWH